MDNEVIYKIVLIGDMGTGKTCMTCQYVKGKMQAVIQPTIGVEFANRQIMIGGKSVKLQIWDTAGHERYRAITQAHYKNTKGMVVAFDITRQATFDNLPNYIKEAKQKADPNLSLILVGSKKDLADQRMVSVEAAQGLAKEHGMEYMEISSMNQEECENVFIALIKQMEANKEV